MSGKPQKTRLTPKLAAATRELLTRWGVADQIDLYQSVALPCISYRAPSSQQDPKPSLPTTFLGGGPLAPPEFTWPCHNGKRIPFIGQIDLSHVPQDFSNPLPASGILYFFCWCTNEEFPNPSQVVWLNPEGSDLVQFEAIPQGTLPDWQGECLYELESCQSVVVGATVTRDRLRSEAIRTGLHVEEQLSEFSEDVLGDVPDEYDGDVVSLAQDTPLPVGSEWGQSLGYAREDFLLGMESCLEGYQEEGEVWLNLLQIPSLGNMLWSDCGYLIFLIRQADLKDRRFDRVRVEVMSS